MTIQSSFATLSLVGLVACAGKQGASRDAGAAAVADAGLPSDAGAGAIDAGFVVAPHAAFPQMPNSGGPVIDHMRLVTITFPGFRFEQEVAAFGDWLVTSDWLVRVGREYGVGAGEHQHVRIAQAAPQQVSAAGIEGFLSSKIRDGTLPADPADAGAPETLYAIFYPPETTMTDIPQQLNCQAFGDRLSEAYHYDMVGPPGFPYAVIPTCGHEDITLVEHSAAHEIIEAVTDPLPVVARGWAFDWNAPWGAAGGEVGDLCDQPLTLSGFSVGRIWSNVAASQGGDPCVPAVGEPYFNVSASPDSPVTAGAGGSVTFTVTGWSTAPVPDWTLDAVPGFFNPFTIATTLGQTHLNNGQSTTLEVRIPADAPSGSTVEIDLDSRQGEASSFWPVQVNVR